jgi:hypothetical protein
MAVLHAIDLPRIAQSWPTASGTDGDDALRFGFVRVPHSGRDQTKGSEHPTTYSAGLLESAEPFSMNSPSLLVSAISHDRRTC